MQTRVLFADDNEDVIEIFKIYCDRYGWAGTYVSNVEDLITEVNTNNYDAIVSDVLYGEGVTGITAIKSIRKVKPNIPIIFISSYTNNLLREEIRRADATFIHKPDYEQLFVTLAERIAWCTLSSRDKGSYTGPERRVQSFSMGYEHRRRSTDKVELPEHLSRSKCNNERR